MSTSKVIYLVKEENSIFKTVEEARLLNMQIKALEKQYKELSGDIKNYMYGKDTEELVNQEGLIVATFKLNQVRRFDSKKLKADCEDIYNEYVVISEQRPLLLK
ncbi:MAG: hypothetical protein B6I17_04190 [Tenericutes bacterium 4572_104]|nr:MAG: hypothetical protein B6I17_04190 [Tenericutes bacterium 4572_104]